MPRGLPLAALALLLAGCPPTLPAYTIHVPPRIVEVRPARSVIFARTNVPLEPLRAALDGALPPKLEGGGSRKLPLVGSADAHWTLQRQPAELRATSEGLEMKLAELGEVTLAAGPIHCRAERGGFVLESRGRPSLSTSGALELADPRVTIRPLAPLDCGVPVPLGALLEKVAAPLATGLGLALREVRLPLSPLLDRALDELHVPRALELDGKPACLDLDPGALVLAPVGGEGAELILKAGADVAPRVSLGACPPERARARSEVRVKHVPLDEQFQVDVALALPDDELAARLAPALIGRRFGDGGRSVEVRSLELADASGRLMARVDVAGALTGALYLWGTPAIVGRGGRFFVEVPDLRVAAETRSLVTRVALWLWKLRDGGLEAELKRRLSFDVTDRLDAARRALTRRWPLGDTGWSLDTTLARILPGDVLSRPGLLVVNARLVGHAELITKK